MLASVFKNNKALKNHPDELELKKCTIRQFDENDFIYFKDGK